MTMLMKWHSEVDIDQLIRDYDETYMPLPDFEGEPHLLISKVRKHYMEHIVKLLTTNYETNQRLVNKNIYLPSAIWKCAKKLEMKAAQTCMVVQLYRNSIVTMINEVKTETKKGRLYSKLYESLCLEPQNEKRTQTIVTGDCQCQCNDKKRRRKKSSSPKPPDSTLKLDLSKRDSLTKRMEELSVLLQENNNLTDHAIQNIPVVTNMQTDHIPVIFPTEEVSTSQPLDFLATTQPAMTPKPTEKESDDLMQQMEKMFQGDVDDDDLFTSTVIEDNSKTLNTTLNSTQDCMVGSTQDLISTKVFMAPQGSIIENHAAQIKSLDQRLATLTGLLVNSEPQQKVVVQPQKVIQKVKKPVSEWLCEEFFMKKKLAEVLYEIGDNNRQKLARVKESFRHLFGDDNDEDEGLLSPNDSPEFVASCKARIDCWVMPILAQYYAKGGIKGKVLYKSVARHLIELIYKCKMYPSEHEVTTFVMDFLDNRGKIRCEADFKEFRIDNLPVPTNSFI